MQIGKFSALAIGVLLCSACSSSTAKKEEAPAAAPAKTEVATPPYKVRFDTSKGPVVVEDSSRLGADWCGSL